MKVKPGKPNPSNKPGSELKYGNAENIVGGPIVENPSPSLMPEKGVSGSRTVPPVKK